MANEVRNAILDKIVETFRDPANTGQTAFALVQREAFAEIQKGKPAVLAVIDGVETYSEFTNTKIERRLSVELRAQAYVGRGETTTAVAARVLADMENVVTNNETWDGLGIASYLRTNFREEADEGTGYVELSLFFDLVYRTLREDSRRRN